MTRFVCFYNTIKSLGVGLVFVAGCLFGYVSDVYAQTWVIPSDNELTGELNDCSVDPDYFNAYTHQDPVGLGEGEQIFSTQYLFADQIAVSAVRFLIATDGTSVPSTLRFGLEVEQGSIYADSVNEFAFEDWYGLGYVTSTFYFQPTVVLEAGYATFTIRELSGWVPEEGQGVALYAVSTSTASDGRSTSAVCVGDCSPWSDFDGGWCTNLIGSSSATATSWFVEESNTAYTWEGSTSTGWISNAVGSISGMVDEIKYKVPWGYAFLMIDEWNEAMSSGVATTTISIPYAGYTMTVFDSTATSSGQVAVFDWIRSSILVLIWLLFGFWAYRFAVTKVERI